MDSIEEKRVFAGGDRPAAAYVASSTGLVRATVAGELVGEFSLLRRVEARDVVADERSIAVATAEDVLVADASDDGTDADESATDDGDAIAEEAGVDGDAFVETGFGPAVAVGLDDGDVLAAGEDGRVARRRGDEWRDLEPKLGDIRAIDGDLLATADGVYRARDGGIDPAGLDDVRDVSTPGIPLAATGSGLYALGNGWMRAREGAIDVVAADPASDDGRLARAHAVGGGAVLEYDDGEWLECDRADGIDDPGRIVDFGYGEAVYAVTVDGRFLSRTADGWRSYHLGIVDVGGVTLSNR